MSLRSLELAASMPWASSRTCSCNSAFLASLALRRRSQSRAAKVDSWPGLRRSGEMLSGAAASGWSACSLFASWPAKFSPASAISRCLNCSSSHRVFLRIFSMRRTLRAVSRSPLSLVWRRISCSLCSLMAAALPNASSFSRSFRTSVASNSTTRAAKYASRVWRRLAAASRETTGPADCRRRGRSSAAGIPTDRRRQGSSISVAMTDKRPSSSPTRAAQRVSRVRRRPRASAGCRQGSDQVLPTNPGCAEATLISVASASDARSSPASGSDGTEGTRTARNCEGGESARGVGGGALAPLRQAPQ
mmetsp:Transcript_67138/g.185961  ORF Transcript_67138/g.185961 Transcript_67138/m.185961 type:complete len:305 (+) Transcript_67138:294-1208(+)